MNPGLGNPQEMAQEPPSTSSEFILSAGVIVAALASYATSTGGVTLEFDVEI